MVEVRRSVKQKVVAGAAVAALLAGGVVRRGVGDRPEQLAQERSARIASPPRAESRELAAAAGYLGVSAAQLAGELRSGKTLAEVADASAGKSAAGPDRSAARRAHGQAVRGRRQDFPQRVGRRGQPSGRPGGLAALGAPSTERRACA